jgi:DNA-binding protein YbaB
MAIRMKWMAAALAVSIAASAWAAAPEQPDALAEIVEQQRELQQDLDGLEELTPRQRNTIRKAQTQVFALTEGKSRLDDLTIDEKVKLDNALERINAELVNTRAARANQDVCERERRSGSRLAKTSCATADERQQMRENSRNYLERPRICEGVCG